MDDDRDYSIYDALHSNGWDLSGGRLGVAEEMTARWAPGLELEWVALEAKKVIKPAGIELL